MFRFIIIVFLFWINFFQISFAFNQINLSDYKNVKNIIFWKIKKNINININYTNIACNYFKNKEYFYISPWCFLQWKLPKLWVKKTSDLVFPFINQFDNIYNLQSTGFVYRPSNADFFYNYKLNNFIDNDFSDKVSLYILGLKNYFIKVPEIFIAFEEFKNYSLYVWSKDLSNRNKWRLINFHIALDAINDYILYPNQELNFNNLIANKHWYYKEWNEHYLFYRGVCWVSTMLFRNALINNYLYITKRYNHAQWYVYFYSPYIYWDDASVYEYKKIFKLKNISNYPIYFKKKIIWKYVYLVSIVPEKSSMIAYVTKNQIWPLKAEVSTNVFDKNGDLVYKQSWLSNYLKKNYER